MPSPGAERQTDMETYTLTHMEDVVSPALIYYREIMEDNLDQIIALAGGAERLWPHVKTHKSLDMVRLQREKGIERFKCATIAELEMVCQAGAKAGILAMPPAGPTARRLAAVQKAYPDTEVFGIADCQTHLDAYAQAAAQAGITINLLLDVNMGMNRTGVPTAQAGEIYRRACGMAGIRMRGFHCYDGNRHETDLAQRQSCVDTDDEAVFALRKTLQAEGYPVELMVMGGSPSFPCHLRHQEEGVYYSMGTIFLNDIAYATEFPDLKMRPAAAIFCRVISHPCPGYFTLDLGYKGISSETPMEGRGKIAGLDHCAPVAQSEEHWVFRMEPGYEDQRPAVGSELYVIPRHVCPCALLYPSILIAEHGQIAQEWPVTARNRKINY